MASSKTIDLRPRADDEGEAGAEKQRSRRREARRALSALGYLPLNPSSDASGMLSRVKGKPLRGAGAPLTRPALPPDLAVAGFKGRDPSVVRLRAAEPVVDELISGAKRWRPSRGE